MKCKIIKKKINNLHLNWICGKLSQKWVHDKYIVRVIDAKIALKPFTLYASCNILCLSRYNITISYSYNHCIYIYICIYIIYVYIHMYVCIYVYISSSKKGHKYKESSDINFEQARKDMIKAALVNILLHGPEKDAESAVLQQRKKQNKTFN